MRKRGPERKRERERERRESTKEAPKPLDSREMRWVLVSHLAENRRVPAQNLGGPARMGTGEKGQQ